MGTARSVLLAYLVSLIPVRNNDSIIIKHLYFYEGITYKMFKCGFKIIIIIIIMITIIIMIIIMS